MSPEDQIRDAYVFAAAEAYGNIREDHTVLGVFVPDNDKARKAVLRDKNGAWVRAVVWVPNSALPERAQDLLEETV